MSRAAIQQPDLLQWPEIEAAREAVRAAESDRDRAERKLRCAPHGSYKARFKTFSDAVHTLLVAEGHLARVLREAGQ